MIEKLHPELPYFQDDFNPNTHVDFEINPSELNTYYPSASALAKQDPDFQAHAQEIKAKFQDGHAGYFALYEKFLKISLEMMNDEIQEITKNYSMFRAENGHWKVQGTFELPIKAF